MRLEIEYNNHLNTALDEMAHTALRRITQRPDLKLSDVVTAVVMDTLKSSNRDLLAALAGPIQKLVGARLRKLTADFHSRAQSGFQPDGTAVAPSDTPAPKTMRGAETGDISGLHPLVDRFTLDQLIRVLEEQQYPRAGQIKKLVSKGITMPNLCSRAHGNLWSDLESFKESDQKAIVQALRRMSALLREPPASIGLDLRAQKRCGRLGITSVGDLITKSADDLLDEGRAPGIRVNFGVSTLNHIRKKLYEIGLRLAGD